jgi:hypothetical protein
MGIVDALNPLSSKYLLKRFTAGFRSSAPIFLFQFTSNRFFGIYIILEAALKKNPVSLSKNLREFRTQNRYH